MTLIAKRVYELNRIEIPKGTMIIPCYDPETGKDGYILLQNILGNTDGAYPTWSSSNAPYAAGARVTWGFKLWESLVAANSAIPSEGANWTEVSATLPQGAIQVDTTGAVITLDMLNLGSLAFKGSAVIAGNKSVVISNDTASEELKNFRFQVDAAGREFTFEADVKMQDWDGNWTDATKKWISPAAGLFDLVANHINNVWTVRIFGPF